MPPLTAAALRKQLAAGQTDSLYVLLGEDDAEKAAVAAQFLETVDEGLRAFNVDRLYGGERKVDDLIDAAAMLPMMAPRRVVLVLEAEKLLIPRREGKAAEADQEKLEAFIEHPPDHATVVFVCGPLDQRRRVVKLLAKSAHVVDCGTIEDAADAERWLKVRAAREGATLDPGAVRLLVERAGLDIVRLRAGLERVILYALGQPTITADDVRQAVPAGPEAHEDFGIANAIQRGDAAGALRELGLALDAGAVPFVLMGQIRWAAEKSAPPRVRESIEAVFRTDLALKSSGGDPRVLLERLVVELCGSPARRPPARRV
ncbi:MAG: DNA polymerase III subunit delta [Vicinamibacterales bacterium]